MQIDWWTLALQAVNFLVLVWLLWRFLYRPVSEVIAKRKQRAEQAMAAAAEKESDAEAARQRYEKARADLAEERQDALKKIHGEWDAERRKLLEEAKSEAADMMEAARESLAKEREATLKEVRERIADLAVELAAELLRKVGSQASSGAYLARIERQLEDMPELELARLRDDLAADDAVLTVATATPLAAEERAAWAERLGARLGQDQQVDFAADPQILGGAELRFPHAVLKFTLADQLRQAREALRADDAAS
jgi:F-type H+-transporting ATPase subunit b